MLVYMNSFKDLLQLHDNVAGIASAEVYVTSNIESLLTGENEIEYIGPPIKFTAGYVFNGVTYIFSKQFYEYYAPDKYYVRDASSGCYVYEKTLYEDRCISSALAVNEAIELNNSYYEALEKEKHEIFSILVSLKSNPRVVKVRSIKL